MVNLIHVSCITEVSGSLVDNEFYVKYDDASVHKTMTLRSTAAQQIIQVWCDSDDHG